MLHIVMVALCIARTQRGGLLGGEGGDPLGRIPRRGGVPTRGQGAVANEQGLEQGTKQIIQSRYLLLFDDIQYHFVFQFYADAHHAVPSLCSLALLLSLNWLLFYTL